LALTHYAEHKLAQLDNWPGLSGIIMCAQVSQAQPRHW